MRLMLLSLEFWSYNILFCAVGWFYVCVTQRDHDLTFFKNQDWRLNSESLGNNLSTISTYLNISTNFVEVLMQCTVSKDKYIGWWTVSVDLWWCWPLQISFFLEIEPRKCTGNCEDGAYSLILGPLVSHAWPFLHIVIQYLFGCYHFRMFVKHRNFGTHSPKACAWYQKNELHVGGSKLSWIWMNYIKNNSIPTFGIHFWLMYCCTVCIWQRYAFWRLFCIFLGLWIRKEKLVLEYIFLSEFFFDIFLVAINQLFMHDGFETPEVELEKG